MYIEYQGFNINFQNEIPIEQFDENNFHRTFITFNPGLMSINCYKWKIIRCEDNNNSPKDKDLLKEEDLFIGGNIDDFKTIYLTKDPYQIKNKIFMTGFNINNLITSNTILFEDYKRKGIGYFDNFPDIFALWITTYNVFTFIFYKLYSTSFDKYKIIENILSKQKECLSKARRQKSQISIINDINEGDILFQNVSEKEEKKMNLIYNVNDKEDEEIDNETYSKKTKAKQERILPKKCCCDYTCNALFGCICCCIERQKIINNCKEIVLKYYSIENIIYNQVMIENLLVDYQWNNPEHKIILNNDSFKFIHDSLNK